MPSLPLLSVFQTQRPRSKFETLGAELTDNLIALRQNGDTRVHWYQLEAVLKTKEFFLQRSLNHFEVSTPCLIVSPTGAGKSGIIVLLPYVLQSRKTLIITPAEIISNQLGKAFGSPANADKSFFEVSGLETDKEILKHVLEPARIIRSNDDVCNKPLGNLVIVSAQTFAVTSTNTLSVYYHGEKLFEDIRNTFNDFDTIIIDEAHHFPAATWKTLVDTISTGVGRVEKKIIFLTATAFKYENYQQVTILPLQHVAFEISPQKVQGITTRKLEFIERESETTLAADIKKVLGTYSKQEIILVRTKLIVTWKRFVDKFINPAVNGKEKKLVFLSTTPYKKERGQLVPIQPKKHVAFEVVPLKVQGTSIHRKLIFLKEERFTTSTIDIKGILDTYINQERGQPDTQGLILVQTKPEAEVVASKLNEVLGKDFAVPILADKAHQENLIKFNEHNHRVAVTCGQSLEEYDNSNITLCVILRSIKSRALFDQFIGKCVHKNPIYEKPDQTVGTVLSYKKFNQQVMWGDEDSLALNDPVDDSVDDDDYTDDNNNFL